MTAKKIHSYSITGGHVLTFVPQNAFEFSHRVNLDGAWIGWMGKGFRPSEKTALFFARRHISENGAHACHGGCDRMIETAKTHCPFCQLAAMRAAG